MSLQLWATGLVPAVINGAIDFPAQRLVAEVLHAAANVAFFLGGKDESFWREIFKALDNAAKDFQAMAAPQLPPIPALTLDQAASSLIQLDDPEDEDTEASVGPSGPTQQQTPGSPMSPSPHCEHQSCSFTVPPNPTVS